MFIFKSSIFLYSIIQIATCYNGEQSYVISNWTTLNTHFPAADQNSIVVFDNITRDIWIIGGLIHPDNIYKYDIDREILTLYVNSAGIDFGYNYVNNVNAVIINRTIYWTTQSRVSALNIDTMEYTSDIGLSLGDSNMCMVTDRDQTKLYLSSGYWNKKFIIWDLVTSTEVKGAPDTNEAHTGGICQVIDNILYVMSGYHSQIIEYIDLNTINNDLSNAKWNVINDTFPETMYSSSSAIWNDLIFIMGADTANIFVFNVSSKNISNYGSLPINIGYAPSICVESRIYIFMGYWQANLNTLIYADLLSTATTSVPTTNVPTESISTDVVIVSSTINIDSKESNNVYIFGGAMTVCMVAIVCFIGYKMRKTKRNKMAVESALADLHIKTDLVPTKSETITSKPTRKESNCKEDEMPHTLLSMAVTNSLENERKSANTGPDETSERGHERVKSKTVVIVYSDEKESDDKEDSVEEKSDSIYIAEKENIMEFPDTAKHLYVD